MCQSMVNIQSPTAEIRRGKKRRYKEEINYRMKILWSALLHRATIINASGCTFLKISVANFLISLAMTEKPTFCFSESLFLFIVSIPFYSTAVRPWELSTGVKNNNSIRNSILSQGHNFINFWVTFQVSSLSTRSHSDALQ